MAVRDRESVLQVLREWLVKTNPAAADRRIEPDTDIIETRILESLQVVELILFLERQTGRAILAEDLNPATLRTLDSIYSNYFDSRR
jgi:acyl carrier protein